MTGDLFILIEPFSLSSAISVEKRANSSLESLALIQSDLGAGYTLLFRMAYMLFIIDIDHIDTLMWRQIVGLISPK